MVGPEGLLPGRVLQRIVEQIIDEDGVVLAATSSCSPLLWRGGAPASVHRQSGRGVISVEIPLVQFLEKVVEVPVVCDVRCLFETMQKTVEVLQFALIDKVDDVSVVQVVVRVSRQ